ncbi:hypothetical protein H310_09458 [Aphanomyces invadans]|uniref:Uncharacterized protein n=1 Tax=Aphanomyces invadans TaxID=157072 RepID=A0A024TU81_9STRA|nr:hypothetical protein H310_09458 [Aphanomyces invadans]ETV97544.1 hypothetical protein H310_09458 [Aphanomyces invadans]|eukprot:XP_008873753.1 hypothetical protein H310_09458 [Aphanomyces invadans]
MANITATLTLNEHNFSDWKTYFRGRLMAKGMHDQLTASFSMQPSIHHQKALGILIETIEPSQYRHSEGMKHTECRKKAHESSRHGAKMRDTKEDHTNAAIYMFSMFENGQDLDMVNSDDKSKEDEGVQPTVIDAGNTEPIYLGEPGETLPLRTDPDWSATRQPVRQLSIGGPRTS